MSETQIIVIDDFYDEPQKVRDYALRLEYSKSQGSTYPGENSIKKLWHKPLKDKLSGLVNNEIYESPNTANGLFRVSPKDSSFTQDIHVDPGSDWAGVLFLTENTPPIPGTCFWLHREYGFEKCPKTPQEAELYGLNSFEEIRQKIILEDGLDRSKWNCIYEVPYKFNRLVLFRPWLFHSHGENFGNPESKKSQRMVQLFFLREEGGFHEKVTGEVPQKESGITRPVFYDDFSEQSVATQVKKFAENNAKRNSVDHSLPHELQNTNVKIVQRRYWD